MTEPLEYAEGTVLDGTNPPVVQPDPSAAYAIAPASTFNSFRIHGLLAALNIFVAHPRGYGIEWCYPESVTDPDLVEPLGWRIVGSGADEWTFSPAVYEFVFDHLDTLMPTTLLDDVPPRDLALDAVNAELDRQHDLWGDVHDDSHLMEEWRDLIDTYLGKLAATTTLADAAERLIQIAALAISAHCSLTRQHPDVTAPPADPDPSLDFSTFADTLDTTTPLHDDDVHGVTP
jgi:hypothetical protein